MNTPARYLAVILSAIVVSACVSAPAPKYQAPIGNTEMLMRQRPKLSVGEFTAAAGVNNRSLNLRGSQLKGGSDGTFSTYLRDAVIVELQTVNGYDAGNGTRLSGTLTRNELEANVGTGKAAVGAEFVVAQDGKAIFKKSLAAQHEWESSFMGAVAIPAAMDNYATAVQKLLALLFADPDFVAAARAK